MICTAISNPRWSASQGGSTTMSKRRNCSADKDDRRKTMRKLFAVTLMLIGLLSAVWPEAGFAARESALFRPLAAAASRGDLDAVKRLIEQGADVNEASQYNESAITNAAKSGHSVVVKLLIQHGADVDLAISMCEQSVAWGKENWNSSVTAT
ncbi:MAG: hypothetical protein EG826_17645, partial [Deltaproteobacteria bacterium]|nr:hypothetical protein [Deltaproteobacteria bacterium]